MIGLEPLQFFLLGKQDIKRSDNLVPWLRYWWGGMLMPLDAMGWFEEELRGVNILYTPSPEAMENALDLLLEARLKRPYETHIVVIFRLMTFLWRKNMGK